MDVFYSNDAPEGECFSR